MNMCQTEPVVVKRKLESGEGGTLMADHNLKKKLPIR